MPAVAAAAVTSVAALGGGLIASRGNNRALESQERAAREAMAYQRQKDQQARDDYRFQYNAWRDQFYGAGSGNNGARIAPGLASVPGTSVPGASAPITSAPVGALPGGAPAPEAAPVVPQPVAAPPFAGAPVAMTAQQPRTMADLAGWSEHSRYLQGRV